MNYKESVLKKMKFGRQKPYDKQAPSINIDFGITLYLLFIVYVWTNDFLCVFFQTNGSVLTYICAAIVEAVLLFFLKGKIHIEKPVIVSFDALAVLFCFAIYFLRAAIPDNAFDTVNYHIYLQERPFSNNVTYNFFPCKWINSYAVALADRMHHVFRLALGYRFGTLLNTLIMILIYFQCKRLFRKVLSNPSEQVLTIAGILCVATEQILTVQQLYYVDLFAIPLFLEMIYLVLFQESSNCILLCVMAGVAFAFKYSNAFFVIPIAVFYFCKYFKSIGWKDIVAGLIAMLLPVMPYAVNAYLQTGNPIFPYYNGLFHSLYLDNTNWIETFFGPHTKLETVLWPVYVLWEPNRTYDVALYTGRISISYLVAMVASIEALISRIKGKTCSCLNKVSILYVVLCLIWSVFVIGMIRYALFLEVLGGVITVAWILKCFSKKNFFGFLGATLFSVELLCQCGLSLYVVLLTGYEPGWRYSVLKDPNYWKYNIEETNEDPDFGEFLSDVDCIGIVGYNSGYAALISDTIPVISLNFGATNDYGNAQLDKIYARHENVYTIYSSSGRDYAMAQLQDAGYTTVGEERCQKVDFLPYGSELCLIRIQKA